MTVSNLRWDLGRLVFGVAALATGVITLAGHDNTGGHLRHYIIYAAAATLIFGGAVSLFRRTAKAGAIVLSAAYLAFALLCLPQIVAKPQIYNSWGNFFEQFSLVTGAAILYACSASAWSVRADRIGCILLGICTVSFALEQAIYLDGTAQLVPKWIPPTQMFWAVATTVLFALAAAALLSNRMVLLATRLLTMMLVIFGLLVWVPLLLSNPHSHFNWSETAETFAIAGTAWILADLLGAHRLDDHRPA